MKRKINWSRSDTEWVIKMADNWNEKPKDFVARISKEHFDIDNKLVAAAKDWCRKNVEEEFRVSCINKLTDSKLGDRREMDDTFGDNFNFLNSNGESVLEVVLGENLSVKDIEDLPFMYGNDEIAVSKGKIALRFYLDKDDQPTWWK